MDKLNRIALLVSWATGEDWTVEKLNLFHSEDIDEIEIALNNPNKNDAINNVKMILGYAYDEEDVNDIFVDGSRENFPTITGSIFCD